ncbi:tRNA pseudouridine(38-40) synthase TruA [Aureibacter tunicatorum]|uniref:tRNA pseudouridine synthase A n=1 Tax=Aureibacter tunicatorum TaxID=866807 RepID=A0AAE3XPV3_9BACT|nr:tRNA pseudouridine(38-40) synthase TruA [Aureibacter tunicatorum]MDR6239850.1 tRNA pseudouridine38-40 synthase [Aureibacter tunicatorum]BDD04325.1 tRNA pseudouridine synthase A [Aureibacter tunicatorum]
MKKKWHCYLIRVQYLGFRYHGWQRQPGVKTIQSMLEKTIRFVLQREDFKILGASRTDAMVSANSACFELFAREEIELDPFFQGMKSNLPHDIDILSAKPISDKFNIIQDSSEKEYVYLFSYGNKNNAFAAPFMTYKLANLNIEKMKEAAILFEGNHDFRRYCIKPSEETVFSRTINHCRIEVNTLLTANFFPEKSYMLRIKGRGFLRNQVRLIMGALFEVGLGNLSLEEIKDSLSSKEISPICHVAPASGLMLNKIDFDNLNNDY